MREILYRGKRVGEGTWKYGSYVEQYGATQIYLRNGADEDGFDCYHVEPETVGQYTGLTDKNGTKIFEGDIVTVPLSWDGDDVMDIGRVFYSERSCGFYRTSKAFGGVFGVASGLSGIGTDEYEVIGNIYDNPELIGEKTND